MRVASNPSPNPLACLPVFTTPDCCEPPRWLSYGASFQNTQNPTGSGNEHDAKARCSSAANPTYWARGVLSATRMDGPGMVGAASSGPDPGPPRPAVSMRGTHPDGPNTCPRTADQPGACPRCRRATASLRGRTSRRFSRSAPGIRPPDPVPTIRVARLPADPLRPDGPLRPAGRETRDPFRGPGRRKRLGPQSPANPDPLPSRDWRWEQTWGVFRSRRLGDQAAFAGDRSPVGARQAVFVTIRQPAGNDLPVAMWPVSDRATRPTYRPPSKPDSRSTSPQPEMSIR